MNFGYGALFLLDMYFQNILLHLALFIFAINDNNVYNINISKFVL